MQNTGLIRWIDVVMDDPVRLGKAIVKLEKEFPDDADFKELIELFKSRLILLKQRIA